MPKYIAGRLVNGFITFFISITITFIIVRAMPADPVAIMIDPRMSPEIQQMTLERFGLDRPIHEQYIIYIRDIFRGDLGTSFRMNQPVTEVLMQRLPWTLLLLVLTVCFTLLIGIPVGIFAACRSRQFADRVINFLVTLGISIFLPFLAFGLLYLFAYVLRWFPTGGAFRPPAPEGFALVRDVLRHAVLPSLALIITNLAGIVLYTRNSMNDVLREDYIRTAYAKGLSSKKVVRVHAIKNALIPTVTITGIMIGTMVGGAVMTETIFAWPGIGRLIFDSVNGLDYPVIQGAFIILAATVILMNIIVDLVVAWLDPRIRLGGG